MTEITSTLKTTLVECCEAANWMTSKFYNYSSMEKEIFVSLKTKLDALQPIVEKYERSFRTSHVILEEELLLKLENASSSLWNSISIALKTEINTTTAKSNLPLKFILCRSKLFTALLLSIHESLQSTSFTKIRTFKCFINCLKILCDCFEENTSGNSNIDWISLINKCQEYSHKHIDYIESYREEWTCEEVSNIQKIKFQYYLLNFQIYLKDGDIANSKLYSAKISIKENISYIDSNTLLEICRITYNACLALYEKSDDENNISYKNEIIPFLKQVKDYLKLPIENLQSNDDFGNVNFAVLSLLVNVLIDQFPNISTGDECEYYINCLEKECSQKIETFSLSIKFCKKKETENMAPSIEEIIMKMITSIDIFQYFDNTLDIIKDLSKIETKLSSTILDYILLNKLDPKIHISNIEKLIVSRFFLTIQSSNLTLPEIIHSLSEFCQLIEKTLVEPLSKTSMACIITLLWNNAKKLDKKGEYQDSIKFYKLAQTHVLSKNYVDIGKIQRALLSAYINCEYFEIATRCYDEMSNEDKMHPLTQLLMIKICLGTQNKNIKEIETHLQNISSSEINNSTEILIMAVSYCKISMNLTLFGIQLLFKKLEENNLKKEATNLEHWVMPTLSLIRYTIQVILKISEDEVTSFEKYFLSVYELLQKAQFYLKNVGIHENIAQNNSLDTEVPTVSVDEIEWFSSISYNIVAKIYNENIEVDLKKISDLLFGFIESIPIDQFTFPKLFHFRYWKFRCVVLKMLLIKKHIISGKEKFSQNDENFIKKGIEEVLSFKNHEEYKSLISNEEMGKIEECLLDMFSLQLECSLYSDEQSVIFQIFENIHFHCSQQTEIDILDILILCDQCPKGRKKEIIGKFINRYLGIDNFSICYLCYWLKVMLEFETTIDDLSEREIAENVLRRAKLSSQQLEQNSFSESYTENIEIIATLSWNKGINFLIGSDKMAAISWCKLSIEFAAMVNKGLEEQLKKLWKTLSNKADIEVATNEYI